MTCHQYSGWEHVLRQTARRRGLVPAESPSAAAEWQRRRGWRGQHKHLYPNWWSFLTALFVKVNMKHLYYKLLVTFLGVLNVMTYHPVPARYIGGGNVSSCSLFQSSRTWAWAAGWGEPENLDVIKPDAETLSDGAWRAFPAIWLLRNEACWRAFVIMATKSEKRQHWDGLAGILWNKQLHKRN